MQTTHHKTVNLSVVYGIAISVISIVFTIIFYLTDVYGNLWTGYFVNLLMFLGVLFAIIHYNRQHHEKPSMAALFAMGFRTTIWATVIISIFNIIFHFIIVSTAPHTMSAADESTATSSMGVDMNRNFWIFLVTNVLFTNAVLGLLASVIGAMVFKKNQKTTKPD